MVITDDGNDKLEQQEFTCLISYSPKLQEIDLRGSEFNNTYMTYLRNIDSTIYLKHIEKIWGGRASRNQDHYAYFATYYNFRKTLTRAALNLTQHKPTLILDGKTGDALSFLSDFECLNELVFGNNEEYSGDLTIYDVSRICPKLHTLFFDYRHADISDQRLNVILGGLGKEMEFLSTINHNIQELNMHLPTLSSSYINLITRCIPTHMKTLSITLYDTDTHDWIEKVDWCNALKLAQHMHSVPYASIQFRSESHDDMSVSRDKSRMTQLFRLFGAIKDDKRRQGLYCTAGLPDCCPNYTTICVNDDKEIVFEYGLGGIDSGEDSIEEDEEEEEESQEASFERISDAFEMSLPDLEKSLVGPDVVNCWKICICRAYPSIPYRLLKYSLANCPRL